MQNVIGTVYLQGAKKSVGPWCWVSVLLTLAGCGDSFSRKMGLSDLESPNPTVRIMAIKWAGDNKVSAAVPQLVDLLEDEDPSVRFYAIEGLRRITGTDNGYDYKSAALQRAAAVKRWRKLVDQNEF
ncbi:MAG: HEAT repeat domain-containing protein [Planctomycetota bacterium]|jgi:hypothetical protein